MLKTLDLDIIKGLTLAEPPIVLKASKTSLVLKLHIAKGSTVPKELEGYEDIVIKITASNQQEINSLNATQDIKASVDFIGSITDNFNLEKLLPYSVSRIHRNNLNTNINELFQSASGDFRSNHPLLNISNNNPAMTIIVMEGMFNAIDSDDFLLEAYRNLALKEKVLSTVQAITAEFHQKWRAHGDLRARNIYYNFINIDLKNKYHPDNIIIKVGDLGSSAKPAIIQDEYAGFVREFNKLVQTASNFRTTRASKRLNNPVPETFGPPIKKICLSGCQ